MIQPVVLGLRARWTLAALLALLVAAEGWLAVPNAMASFWQLVAEHDHAAGKLVGARAAAERACAWDSRNGPAALILGDVALSQARFSSGNANRLAEQALQGYQRAAQLNPLEAEPVSRQALALEFLGQWKASEEAHRRALTLDPSYNLYYERLGMFHAARGDTKTALAEIQARYILKCTTQQEREHFLNLIRSLTASGEPRR